MSTIQTPVSNAIRYNYLQVIEKLKKEYQQNGISITKAVSKEIREKAYQMNRNAIIRCFTYEATGPNDSIFNSFTREGNSRKYIFDLSNGDPNVFKQELLKEFIATKPLGHEASILRNAVGITTQRYSITQACNAIRTCLTDGKYDYFSRGLSDKDTSLNYRQTLAENVKPEAIANILLSTAISPQRETIQSIVNKIKNKFKNLIKNKYKNIKNLSVNPQVASMSVVRAVDKNWSFNKHVDINLGHGLHASSDIGRVRKNQEDSLAIMYHPKNPGFKMLVVSDGMGGIDGGEYASSYVVEKISEWFNKLPPGLFNKNNVERLKEHFENEIKRIDRGLNDYAAQGKAGGATFCGAIVTQEQTIISNVGDSRAYIYTHGKEPQLKQVTRDDNVAYKQYELGLIEKDDVRFSPVGNQITQSMGGDEQAKPKSTIIPNSSYDCLMLMSDGISDCLNDAQIKVITEKTPKDLLANMLIRVANSVKSISRDGKRTIKPGKDNSTVAVYSRDSRKNEGFDR